MTPAYRRPGKFSPNIERMNIFRGDVELDLSLTFACVASFRRSSISYNVCIRDQLTTAVVSSTWWPGSDHFYLAQRAQLNLDAKSTLPMLDHFEGLVSHTMYAFEITHYDLGVMALL